MKKIILNRLITNRGYKEPVIGELITEEGKFLCVTLELPDRQNKEGESCIPCGTYEMFKRISSRNNTRIGGVVYELKDVPERENIQIHIGNFLNNTSGCILVGKSTNNHILIESTKAMKELLEFLGGENAILEVRNA